MGTAQASSCSSFFLLLLDRTLRSNQGPRHFVQSCSQGGTATCYWPTMENFRKPTEGSGIFRRESYQRGTGLSSGKGLRTQPPLGHSRRCAWIVVVNRRLQKLAPFVRQKQETMSEIAILQQLAGCFDIVTLGIASWRPIVDGYAAELAS